jgi:hypothetical protein
VVAFDGEGVDGCGGRWLSENGMCGEGQKADEEGADGWLDGGFHGR